MYLLVLAVLTCVARRVQGRAWCGLDRVACLVACDSVLPKIILETIGQSPPRRLDARERVPPAWRLRAAHVVMTTDGHARHGVLTLHRALCAGTVQTQPTCTNGVTCRSYIDASRSRPNTLCPTKHWQHR